MVTSVTTIRLFCYIMGSVGGFRCYSGLFEKNHTIMETGIYEWTFIGEIDSLFGGSYFTFYSIQKTSPQCSPLWGGFLKPTICHVFTIKDFIHFQLQLFCYFFLLCWCQFFLCIAKQIII